MLRLSDVEDMLARIDLGKVLYDRPSFVVSEVTPNGYLIQLRYYEADVGDPDGEPKLQCCREWYIDQNEQRTAVIRTAYKAVLCSLEHRLGEHFRVNGARPYNPHHPIYALCDIDRRPA